jgi:zinc transporter
MENNFAYSISKKTDYNKIEINDINNFKDSFIWINLDQNLLSNNTFLKERANVDDIVASSLLANDTRVRYFEHNNGLLLILRAINLNPKEEPDDMVSLRIWIESNRVITVFKKNVKAIRDLENEILDNNAPTSSNELLIRLIDKISNRISESVTNINDLVEDIEDNVFEKQLTNDEISSQVRKQIIKLKRYLYPQKDVLFQLSQKNNIFSIKEKANLIDNADKITRYVEELEVARERTMIALDEIETLLARNTNKILYRLSIISVIFLPLSFITGLLGINVNGIPGSTFPFAFIIVCAILIVLFIIQLFIFRKLKWV